MRAQFAFERESLKSLVDEMSGMVTALTAACSIV